MTELLKHVKNELSKVKKNKSADTYDRSMSFFDSNNYAYQELYELTQRKFLRHLIQFSDNIATIRSYPRLFFLDLIDEKRFKRFRYKKNSNKTNDNEKEDIEDRPSSDLEIHESRNFALCLRPMCEHDECWHFSEVLVLYPKILSADCVYLLRLMTILKNGNYSNQFGVLFTEQGKKIFDEIKEKAAEDSTDICDSYNNFRNYFIKKYEEEDFYSLESDSDLNNNFFALNKCELKNGKILWLCPDHSKKSGGKVILDQKQFYSRFNEQEKNKLIVQLDQVEIDIF